MDLESLFNLLEAEHECTPVDDEKSFDAIDAFEQKFKLTLPADMRRFYQQFNGALISDTCRILSIEEMTDRKTANESDESLPATWLTFADVWNSGEQMIAIDVTESNSHRNIVIDLEMDSSLFYCAFAKSFTEFLRCELHAEHPDYWIGTADSQMQKVRYQPSSMYYRELDQAYWNALDETPGTLICKHDECDKANISVSVFCKQHHYEQSGVPCPFVPGANNRGGLVTYFDAEENEIFRYATGVTLA